MITIELWKLAAIGLATSLIPLYIGFEIGKARGWKNARRLYNHRPFAEPE